MKGKIFAMFAVFAAGIILLGGMGTADAATIDESKSIIKPIWGSVGVSVSTDKEEYNVPDDVEITVSSSLHVMGVMPPIFTTTGVSINGVRERVTRVEGWAFSYLTISDEEGNTVYRSTVSSLHATDTGRYPNYLLGAWDSETVKIIWDKTDRTDRTGTTVPAGDYTVTAYISGYVEVTTTIQTTNVITTKMPDGSISIVDVESTTETVTEYHSLESATSSVTITLRGNPNGNQGAEHIPDNQGTAHNPNL